MDRPRTRPSKEITQPDVSNDPFGELTHFRDDPSLTQQDVTEALETMRAVRDECKLRIDLGGYGTLTKAETIKLLPERIRRLRDFEHDRFMISLIKRCYLNVTSGRFWAPDA